MSDINNTLEYICERAKDPAGFALECETRYEKTIKNIAGKIALSSRTEIVMLAGPSSAGKTTTAKKLRDALSDFGINSYTVSLDDFYLNACDSPRFPDGSPDFETVYALDIDCFQKTMKEITETGTGYIPEFDFLKGERKPELRKINVTENDVIIVEGLHALNPIISDSLPQDRLLKLYINVSSRIYDKHGDIVLNRRNIRFLRRIVRDSKSRGISVEKNFALWAGVCYGEDIYLFPFRDNADIKLNTVHLYEISVIKEDAERLLKEVDKASPYYKETQRLLKSLGKFPSIDKNFVPEKSLLREFIGEKEKTDG